MLEILAEYCPWCFESQLTAYAKDIGILDAATPWPLSVVVTINGKRVCYRRGYPYFAPFPGSEFSFPPIPGEHLRLAFYEYVGDAGAPPLRLLVDYGQRR